MTWRDILDIETPDKRNKRDKSLASDPFCHFSHFSLKDCELENEAILSEIINAGRRSTVMFRRSIGGFFAAGLAAGFSSPRTLPFAINRASRMHIACNAVFIMRFRCWAGARVRW